MARELARHLEVDKRLPTALLSYDVAIPAYEFICMYLMVQVVHELEPDTKGFYTFPRKLARVLTGEHGKNKDYRRLEQAVDFLRSTSIRWNVAREDKTVDVFTASFIATKRVNTKDKNPSFRLNPDILEIIKTTKVFSPMNLLMLAVFSHYKNAYPLYVFLNDTLSRGASEVYVTLDQLRILFGVEKSAYEGAFKDFNRYQVKPIFEFIQKRSDINFEFRSHKEGRKVIGIVIHNLHFQQWQQVLFNESSDKRNTIVTDLMDIAREITSSLKGDERELTTDQYIKRLFEPNAAIDDRLGVLKARYQEHGVGLKKVRELASNPEVGVRGLQEVLDQCEADFKARASGKRPIKDLRGHIGWALTVGWKEEGYGLKTAEEREREDAQKDQTVQFLDRLRKIVLLCLTYQQRMKQYQLAVDETIYGVLKQRDDVGELESFSDHFGQSLQTDWAKASFKRDGVRSKTLRSQLITHIQDGDYLEGGTFPEKPVLTSIDEQKYEAYRANPAYKSSIDRAFDLAQALPFPLSDTKLVELSEQAVPVK